MFDQAAQSSVGLNSLSSSIAESRAEMALSREEFQESEIACRRILRTSTLSAAESAHLKRILGLAEMGAGSGTSGLRLCEDAYREASKIPDAVLIVNSTLSLLQALGAAEKWSSSISMEPDVRRVMAHSPESNWKALTLLARAHQSLGHSAQSAQLSAEARSDIAAIRSRWGDPTFQLYLSRPDVQKLWRILQAIHSNPREEKL